MQNAGQQYGQGGASSHQGAPYGHTDSSSSNSGSITSSLRQFRKKDVDKQHVSDTNNTPAAESHVARVAPHNHYPPRPSECFRYPTQFPDYSLPPSQVKYSEITDPQQQDQIPPSVIQKAKGKEYMEMCNVQQNHMKQSYTDHINGQQAYPAEPNPHAHVQYLQKDPQVHPSYKPESQYFSKETPYQQLPHQQIPKYNMPPQVRKYPTENDFLSKLRRIHPTMARSIMSDHHLQESQPSYQNMDQNRMYPPQNQRYVNYSASLQSNPYPHGYMPSQHYSNYPSSCSYTRPPPTQMGTRFPTMNPHERSMSPRRGFTDNLGMSTVNYGTMPQKISPNYPQYNAPEYSQHYQHRRAALAPQEYYQQHCRAPQYLPHQMAPQEIPENRVTVSDNIKQYIENWADEETASEMNQLESGRLCKENLRVRDDQSTETVYMINASELQYLENAIPLVTSENGIPLVTSENGQYILKSGVAIDNSTGVVRLVDKNNQIERVENNADRIVNLHIMDPSKPDCMLAKPNDLNQRQSENLTPKVVIHQNTVIQPSLQNVPKDFDQNGMDIPKLGNSLPMIAADHNLASPLVKFEENIFKKCKKETVDKNCSPINMEKFDDQFEENLCQASVICPTKLEEDKDEKDTKTKNISLIDMLTEDIPSENNAIRIKQENPAKSDDETVTKLLLDFDDKREQNTSEECKPKEYTNTTENEDKDGIMENVKKEEEVQKVKEENVKLQSDIAEDTRAPTEEHSGMFSEMEGATNITPLNEEKILITTETVETIIEENENLPKNCEEHTTQEEEVEKAAPRNTTLIDVNMAINLSEEKSSKRSVEDTSVKLSNKRASRSFSVDDIMNNIGNKPNHDRDLVERRRSLQLTREKEVEESYKHLWRQKEISTIEHNTENENTKQTKEKTMDTFDTIEKQETTKNISEEQTTDGKKNDAFKNILLDSQHCANSTECSCNNNGVNQIDDLQENIVKESSDTCVKISNPIEGLEEKPKGDPSIPDDLDKTDILEDSNVKHAFLETISHNEVQYRNVIRVEENSVLLQIAGELVEINVNTINGKKVITVVPLSETTVVDFNDNYETLDSPQSHDPIKSDVTDAAQVANLLPVEVVPETDLIESTSEIIIGMDISLEEEVQLDLEKPPLFTKAAKKAYDSDLQIPAITTSEDINDNKKVDSDVANDKVSSSKEQSHLKHNKEDVNVKVVKDSECIAKEDKGVKKMKKVKLKEAKMEDEEEFVPFKDLVKARKLKKLKLQQSKCDADDVSADSTNKIDQEDNEATAKLKKSKEQDTKKAYQEDNEAKTKLKKSKEQDTKKADQGDDEATTKLKKSPEQKAEEELVKKVKSPEIKQNATKTKNHKPKIPLEKSLPKTDEGKEIKEIKQSVAKTIKNHAKDDSNAVNSTEDTPAVNIKKKEIVDDIKDKVPKKVTFGGTDFKEPLQPAPEAKSYKLSDPRIKAKSSWGIMVPSVSEILKENERLESGKRKLSLEEYNKRKRKLSANNDVPEQVKIKKNNEVKAESKISQKPKVDERKLQRPKSLDDIKLLRKPKDPIHAKRKLSLEITSCKPNCFDWEETQSPKTNPHCQEADKRLNEFSGLIKNNKSKIVIDINDLSVKPTPSEDEILQNYKEQVDSKLSSLNIQIPRSLKPNNMPNPLSNPEMNNLMRRFLRNEKVTYEEMERIKQVISYKRLMQHMHKLKPQDLMTSPLNPSYEIRKNCTEKDMKLHLKKVPENLKVRRNVCSESTTDSDSGLNEPKKSDYSVIQSNCLAAGVPKLIIKRKTEMPVPVVRLERLDLGLLVNKKRKIY